MLAKMTSKNQITLPQTVITRFIGVDQFDGSTDGECITLRPQPQSDVDEVRARRAALAELSAYDQEIGI
jgi:hypothetical protein